jgi:predicted nucleic-acid-binding protein
MEEMNDSKKHALMFLFTFIAAAVIIGTVIFPFWNLIREDVYEEVEILLNERDKCYVDTSDNIPKTIDNCIHKVGDIVTIKYGKDLAYAEIVNP